MSSPEISIGAMHGNLTMQLEILNLIQYNSIIVTNSMIELV